MTNVEIYDMSNSELSSDEYSHEEDDDALMEAAVGKQASPGSTPMKAGGGEGGDEAAVAVAKPKPSDGGSIAADAAGKDQIPEAGEVMKKPPSTLSETKRRILQLQIKHRQYNTIYKRRSLLWDRQNRHHRMSYLLQMVRNVTINKRKYFSRSESRSLSYSRSPSRSRSRSRSPSPSRSPSRSSDRSRSVSRSPDLICLDDTENEDSPEKPEEAKAADLTPCKVNKGKIIMPTPPPAQPQFGHPEKDNEKSAENGGTGSSVLEEFLMIKEPKQAPSQAGIELDKLTASLELEEGMADTTLVQQQQPDQVEETAEHEAMAVDVTLKRRRSVTPPLSNDKRPRAEDDDDDDTIEFLPVSAQNSAQKIQHTELPPKSPVVIAPPTANPFQSQPAFKLSTPYTLALSPEANSKLALNLTGLSQSLNTPTPPPVAMEISYPTQSLPHITKSNIAPEQLAPSLTVPTYGAPYAAPAVQLAPPARPAQAQVGTPRGPQAATSGAAFGTPRVLHTPVGTPRGHQPPPGPSRASVPLQTASPRVAAPLHAAASPYRPVPPQQQLQQQPPPAAVHQEQPQASFVMPQQPQPRRSETVSTQTMSAQPEEAHRPPRPAAPDLKNSSANFHYRMKELFPEIDSIFRQRIDSVRPDPQELMKEIDTDVKLLEGMIVQKEDELNRLNHLRCMKLELRGRMERKGRLAVVEQLMASVINMGCSTGELIDLHKSTHGEDMAQVSPFISGPASMERLLNNLEVNQNDIQSLRGLLGMKQRDPAASRSIFEEEPPQNYRRNSLPVRQVRDTRRDAAEEQEELEYNYNQPPASKRARTLHGSDRYPHERTNSTPNLAAAASSRSKLSVPGKQYPYSSHSSFMGNDLENESQIQPLYNSSPMVHQRNQGNYDARHSIDGRREAEVEDSRPSKGPRKWQRGDATTVAAAAPATMNGNKNEPLCYNCRKFEAIFQCSACRKTWYCSKKCQHADWNSHSEICGA